MSAETDHDAAAVDVGARIVAGQPAAIARAITWCEGGGPRAEAVLRVLPGSNVHVIGITGAPGAGKSTLVSALVRAYRSTGTKVGVVAVDPSSPISGGALLGDRVRLEQDGRDDGLFFRSLASRGASGGLSTATRGASRVLGAAGFGVVIIETVGAGQAEVDIMRVADTVLVVLTPGAGDEMQALKAGIMEIADVFVLNKADQPGMSDLKGHVSSVLHLRDGSEWTPPIEVVTARESKGIEELVDAIERHRVHLLEGTGELRAEAGRRAEVLRLARAAFESALLQEERELAAANADGAEVDEVETARDLTTRAALRVLSERAEH